MVNVSGGNKDMHYSISGGYLDQDGLFKTFGTDDNSNFKYQRYNYRANLDLQVTKLSSLAC